MDYVVSIPDALDGALSAFVADANKALATVPGATPVTAADVLRAWAVSPLRRRARQARAEAAQRRDERYEQLTAEQRAAVDAILNAS
jgi:Mg-chelatase subunit ChlI